MLRSVVQRFLCRRYAPLLTPYGEGGGGGLSAAVRARVAAHLAVCPNCRAEFAEREAVSALLRAHVPAPAAPAADLWSKLEARIQAEAPRPQLAPLVQSGPLPPSPEPRFVWNVFGRAFASAGMVVGGAVAMTLVVLQKGLEVFPLSRPTLTAAVTAPPETVTIALIPKATGFGVRGSGLGGRGTGRPQGLALPQSALRRDAPRVAAESRSPNPASRPLKSSLTAPALTAPVAQTSPVAQTRRPIRLEIRHENSFAEASARYATSAAKRGEEFALAYVEPRESQGSRVRAFDASDNLKENVKDGFKSSYYYEAVRADAAGDAPTTTARVPLRQVAWVPDAELEARAVPASASAADGLMQERQRQTLFSYTR